MSVRTQARKAIFHAHPAISPPEPEQLYGAAKPSQAPRRKQRREPPEPDTRQANETWWQWVERSRAGYRASASATKPTGGSRESRP